MTRSLLCAAVLGLTSASTLHAQRYLTEVFTDGQVVVTSNVSYGVNFRFFPPVNWQGANVPTEIGTLHGIVAAGGTIPPEYFNPADASTTVKVQDLKMDIYEPDQSVDSEDSRPVILYVHTGNALPPPINGSPTGMKTDSSAVEICRRFARRGFVAVSMEYRAGWNPLGSTLQERRGTLLNAVYRALHDVRQCTRSLRQNAAGANSWAIDPDRIVFFGEGTGGYIVQASATLDQPGEIFIEKFLPNPLDPTTSYIDTVLVGNFQGFCTSANPFCLSLYQDNGQSSDPQMTVNLGGALADTSWLEAGDVPSVSLHTVFDPFAPFTEGTVIVPTTGEQVVDVQGSNFVQQLQNDLGNNSAFATLPSGDPFTNRARALYGTNQTHGSVTVAIRPSPEGLFPFVTPNWPAQIPGTLEEASPWQWWDPNSPLALYDLDGAGPGTLTAGQASQASNPNFSPAKGRAYIDTIMGYATPRIVCALQIGPCSLVSLDESDPIAMGVELFPNPTSDRVTVVSGAAKVQHYELFDVNGRLVRTATVNSDRIEMDLQDLDAGVYYVQLHYAEGALTRKVVLDR